MDGLTLIRAAHALGMTVNAQGDKLIIRGPKQYRPIATALIENKVEVLGVLAGPVDIFWPQEASEVFLERLSIADDLELDTSPGSTAWLTAVREAKRAGAGIPARFNLSREPDAIDAAIASFEFLGGVKYVSTLPSEEEGAA